MKRIVIINAKRTPFGRFQGELSQYSPIELGVRVAHEILSELDPASINQVILGNVLGAGHGMNIARQISIGAGIPIEAPAMTVNMMCGSGLQTAILAANAIRSGESNAVLIGGTESMSQSPLLLTRPPRKQSPDFENVTDSMLKDGLVDCFDHLHMGEQAETLATENEISRMEQDCFALRSQQLYRDAQLKGAFDDELLPVGDLDSDEHPRPDITLDSLSELKPVFRQEGTVTAGNASGINDGAAFALLADRDYAIAQGWPILAEWVDGVTVGCDPARMGLGPVDAIESLMTRTGKQWKDIDTLELNEAFAAQVLSCLKRLNFELPADPETHHLSSPDGNPVGLNCEGGAIALGHPLAVSGSRILGHLAWKIHRGHSQSAIASLCVGGGMGVAAMLIRHE